MSMGTEWVDFVGVVEAHGLVFEARTELVRRFEHHIFLPTAEKLAAISEPEQERSDALQQLKELLDSQQLPHLGPQYTQRALGFIGWGAASADAPWVAAARLEAWAALGISVGSSVRTERIVAWVAAGLRFRDHAIDLPGRLVHMGVPAGVDEDVRALLRPTFRHMARDDHAERVALLLVLNATLNGCKAGTAALAELAGSVRLYISHFPCLSCVAVLAQFACLTPGIAPEVAFDDGWEDG